MGRVSVSFNGFVLRGKGERVTVSMELILQRCSFLPFLPHRKPNAPSGDTELPSPATPGRPAVLLSKLGS